MIVLPALKHFEGSWAIVRTKTGECVMELQRGDAKLAESMDGDRYHAIGIAEYLSNLNSGRR